MSVTPDFVGQRYKDTNTGNIWIANSTTPGDWTLELQNAQLSWSPTAYNLSENIGFLTYGDFTDPITDIVFLCATNVTGFDIEDNSVIESISWPNMVSVDPLNVQGGYIYLSGNTALTSISCALLESSKSFYLTGSPLLSTLSVPALKTLGSLGVTQCGISALSFPSLLSVINGIQINQNASLVTASFPLLQTCSSTINADNCAALQTFSAPSLTTITGALQCNNATLTSLVLTSLQSCSSGVGVEGSALTQLLLPAAVTIGGFLAQGSTSLTTVSVPLLVPVNGQTIDFNNCALDATSVNLILARCVANAGFVSGTVRLNDGTNAAPSGQGIADKATLLGRGVGLLTN